MGTQTVQRDLYTWQVRYADDTWLSEYDDGRPDGRGWAEVAHAFVECIDLRGESLAFSVRIPDDALPIFFRRRSIEFHPNTQSEQRRTVHCIGWKRGENGVYLFVFEDGRALLSDDLQAV